MVIKPIMALCGGLAVADIRTNCPTKLCYLQKCSVSSYQFIYFVLRISINISRCRVNILDIPVYYILYITPEYAPCASVFKISGTIAKPR